MRILMLVLTAILASAAMPARAQTVIDVEGQKPASPPVQDQRQVQPPQAPAEIQDSAPPASSSRYSFNRVDNGFLRLNNESGEVAYCNPRAVGWACQAATVDRAALETEIASLQRQIALLKKLDTEVGQLQDELASLKKEIAGLKRLSPPRPPGDLTPSPEKGSDVSVKLPIHQDIARARDYLGDTWRRLVEMIIALQKDIMRKG